MAKEAPPQTYQGLPVVTAQRMREIDEAASEVHGIPYLELMENAGRAVAAETVLFLAGLGKELKAGRVAVCCGRGSNGGDGLVAARLLKEGGADISVCLCPPKPGRPGEPGRYPEAVQANLDRARASGLPILDAADAKALAASLERSDVVLDALLGTGASGKPAGLVGDVIRAVNRSRKPVIAIDVPSGLQPDTGYHSGVYITATLTLTLGLAKRGLVMAHARKYVGALKVLDIGFPQELLAA
ncbi:MAG: NAD(P)H-hydrate epimerase [Elusimicrobia bacterium]|nr:NAD(P)H-hydrate epimerase [Elusimicrobiota bacterium]